MSESCKLDSAVDREGAAGTEVKKWSWGCADRRRKLTGRNQEEQKAFKYPLPPPALQSPSIAPYS